MNEESLKKRIENYLQRKNCWVNGGEIERLAMEAGYKASNASRRCREMESGKLSNGKTCPIVLEAEERKGIVWYRHLQGRTKELKPLPVKPKVEIIEIDGQRIAKLV